MKKFSKIFESKGDLLSKLGTSEDEIKEMCSDLIDEGYEFDIDIEYIGTNGQIYHQENQTSQYYPSIEIDLHRPTTTKDDHYESDNKTKEQFNDVRNWNGSVYYESNINILKSIYDLCYRFESTFTSDKADVFFSMRSINEVKIRITLGVETTKAPLDFSEVKEYLRNGFLHEIQDDTYFVEDNFFYGDGRQMSCTIRNKRDSTPVKKIIDRILKSGELNDSDYLREIFKTCVHDLFNFCKKQNNKLSLKWKNLREMNEFATICIGNQVLIKIGLSFDSIGTKEIILAKGIFKNRTTTIDVLNMDIKVTFTSEYDKMMDASGSMTD